MNSQDHSQTRWSLAGALTAAIAASVCCLGPLVLVGLGVGGAWTSSLRVLEPYRPIFIAVTLGFLGFAFYRAYRTPAAASCEPGSSCAVPRAARVGRIALWIVAPILLALLAFPQLAPHLFGTNSTKGATNVPIQQVVLKVDGMTCGSCTLHVRESLMHVDGTQDAKVTLDPPEAVVRYDPARTSVQSLEQATAKAGYSSSVKQEK
ncbi:MAG: mercuric transporter MerT family protein [Planctomycetia bacterium]|nr:mercuric transporter MerT family protein [Planctomycetia bacterium]